MQQIEYYTDMRKIAVEGLSNVFNPPPIVTEGFDQEQRDNFSKLAYSHWGLAHILYFMKDILWYDFMVWICEKRKKYHPKGFYGRILNDEN